MKKITYLSIFVLLLGICGTAKAQTPIDIVYHALPTSLTFDIPEEVSQVAGNLQSSVNQVKQIILQAKSDASNLQSAVLATYNNIESGAILDVNGNPGQQEATFCGKPLNKTKTKKIAKKMKQVLLTYPSMKIKDVNETQKQREKFYYDNIFAIHAASVIMQKELKEKIMPKIKQAEECAKGNGTACDIPSSDDGGNNEVLFTYGETLKALDSVIRVWESVTALKARLKAVQAMYNLKPELAVETDKTDAAKAEISFISPLPAKAKAVFETSTPMASAQILYKKASPSLANIEAQAVGSKSESAQIISRTIDFVSPDEAENEHPLIEAESKLEALGEMSAIEETVTEAMNAHNMLKELEEYRQIAEQYVEMQKDEKKALARLQTSEQCAVKYLSSYFKNPVTVWSGVNLGKNVNNHNLRKGISGWAWEAFETAKAAETSSVTTEDTAQTSLDDETLANLKDDPDMQKSTKQAQNISVSLDVSKKEQSEKENRKSALQSWQIGAEAAKMLGKDANKWGTPGDRKMVWTDTKNFYNQYLRRKYDNIKSYLKIYTRNDVLALVVAKLQGKDEDISETNYQKKIREATAEAAEKMVANRKQTAASRQEFDAQSKSALGSLDKQRAALVAKMDKLNAAIRERSNEVADIRSVAGEKAAQRIDDAVNAKVVYPTVGQSVPTTSVDDKIIGADNLSKAIAQAGTEATDDKKIAELEKQVKQNQTKLEAYQKQLDKLDEQIAETKLNAQEQASESVNQGAAGAEQILEMLNEGIKLNAKDYEADVRKNLRAILKASAKANPLINPALLLIEAEQAADVSLDRLYQQVDAVVDKTVQQMQSLGDSLYLASSHGRIVEIHNKMIEELKALTLSYSVAGLIKVDGIAAYAKLLAADTAPETEGFFVGSRAKARDMKAPFAIPDFDLPPVREVFHFDAADFAVIKPQVKSKTAGRALTASEFLNFGGDIPSIWRYMLKDNAFIESPYNLKEALDDGCVNVAFSRGGIMPCVVDGSSIVLDVNSQGEYLRRSDIPASSLPKCLQVKMKKGKPYHTFFDSEVIITKPSPILSGNGTEEKAASRYCTYSELGMILEADKNNNLKFRERAFSAYNTLLDNSDSKKLSNKKKNKIASAQHAMLSRNQIGNFLRQAENEKLMRENLEQYKQQYDERMDKLKESLKSYGFAPSEDFDLIKDNDYKLAVNQLKAGKRQKLEKAVSALAAIDGTDNAPVAEKKANLNKLIAIMKKDTDGLLTLSIVSADENDLEAQLKKAKADKAVVDKYKNSLKEQGKSYNDTEEPYCANY